VFARSVLTRIATWNDTTIIEWAKRLKVSTEVLRISLKEQRIIDNITFNQLKGSRVPRDQKIDPEIGSETGRTRDRKLSLLQRGLSMRYVNECLEALDNRRISHARAAEMLMVREDEMGEIKALFTVSGAQ
jgi:hypothetical protein